MKKIYSKVVNVHPSGNLIRRAYPDKIKFPVQLQILAAYTKDEESEYRTAAFVFSRDFMPMPVYFSPVLLYIIPCEWTFIYSDSLTAIKIMRSIIDCYGSPAVFCYEKHLVDHAKQEYEKGIVSLEKFSFAQWNDILRKYKDNARNEKETCEAFWKVMEKITIDRIRLMEKCILQMFGVENTDLINMLYTPYEYPDASVLKKEDQEKIPTLLSNFFAHKQAIRNQQLGNKKDIEYFNVEEIKTRLTMLPKDQIFKNYMDRLTTMEYLKFLDADEILK